MSNKKFALTVCYSYKTVSYIETVIVWATCNLSVDMLGEIRTENGICRVTTVKLPFMGAI